jgi:hypothetical protein
MINMTDGDFFEVMRTDDSVFQYLENDELWRSVKAKINESLND